MQTFHKTPTYIGIELRSRFLKRRGKWGDITKAKVHYVLVITVCHRPVKSLVGGGWWWWLLNWNILKHYINMSNAGGLCRFNIALHCWLPSSTIVSLNMDLELTGVLLITWCPCWERTVTLGLAASTSLRLLPTLSSHSMKRFIKGFATCPLSMWSAHPQSYSEVHLYTYVY